MPPHVPTTYQCRRTQKLIKAHVRLLSGTRMYHKLRRGLEEFNGSGPHQRVINSHCFRSVMLLPLGRASFAIQAPSRGTGKLPCNVFVTASCFAVVPDYSSANAPSLFLLQETAFSGFHQLCSYTSVHAHLRNTCHPAVYKRVCPSPLCMYISIYVLRLALRYVHAVRTIYKHVLTDVHLHT